MFPPLKRRHFLQLAGSTLVTLGWHPHHLQDAADRYAQALAQTTRRKLALLIGINQYPLSQRFTNLKGCTTDVALQRELLIHRFQFNPQDILILSDDASLKPTRANILTAFEDHLIRQAKADDIVVIHFSGHGSQVADPDPIAYGQCAAAGLNSTFVPGDASNDRDQVNDIMGKTLFLLLSHLATDQVTVVLDTCHAGGGTRGNLRIRAASGGPQLRPSPTELAYQDHWRTQLNWTPETLRQRRQTSAAKGIILAAARCDQEAADVRFEDVDAGAFTYYLTQLLWHHTEPVTSLLVRVGQSLNQVTLDQTPEADTATPNPSALPYYSPSPRTTTAEAVITTVTGDRAQIWLGGVSPEQLSTFVPGLTLQAIDPATGTRYPVQLVSRQGLVGTVQLPPATFDRLTRGALLQEQGRSLPPNLYLRLGLDPSLGADLAPAQALLQRIPRLRPILPQAAGDTPYGEAIHYLLARLTPQTHSLLKRSRDRSHPLNALGLFSQGFDRLIPGSLGPPDEPIAAAIARLTPKLRSLLAARLVKLILNPRSSQLQISAEVRSLDQDFQVLAEAFTVRSGQSLPPRSRSVSVGESSPVANTLPVGAKLQLAITNHESRDLYVSVLNIDEAGIIHPLLPNVWQSEVAATRIPAQTTRIIPDHNLGDRFAIQVQTPGIDEILVIASTAPLREFLLALQTLAREIDLATRSAPPPEMTLDNIDQFLTDLSRQGQSTPSRDSVFSTTAIAALSLTLNILPE